MSISEPLVYLQHHSYHTVCPVLDKTNYIYYLIYMPLANVEMSSDR